MPTSYRNPGGLNYDTPYGQRMRQIESDRRGSLVRSAVLPAAAAFAPAALPFLGGGAASASAAGGVGGATGRFTLGNLLKFAEIGVPAVTQLFGQRANNRAMDRQFSTEQQNLADQLAFAREQETYRRSEADRVSQEERRRWEIEQQNRARELAAAEEQRAFERRLVEEREARKQQARLRLADFLGMGR